MKRNVIAGALAGLTLVAGTSSVLAQDSEEGTGAEAGEETSNGAIVTREEITEEREVLDEDGNPVLDEAGNPVMETVTTGFVQTVETPSGNVHKVTKVEGERAVVEHEFANRPDRAERAERVARADRPDRPERPERPEKPERPERPEKPERPERPDRPGRN